MDIRFINDKNKFGKDIKKMQMYCFGMPEESADWWLLHRFEPNTNLGIFDGDCLAANITIYPYEINFYNKSVGMGGIGCVTTLPEYRQLHCCSNLLVESLKIMRERNQIFSVLSPFSHAFYRKYGWDLAYTIKEYNFDMDDLKKFGTGKGRFLQLTNRYIEKVMLVYDTFVNEYNGAVKRSYNYWKFLLEKYSFEGFHCYGYEDENDNFSGYIIFRKQNKRFHVYEIAYTSLSVKLELLKFIYMHRAQAKEITWIAPYNDNTILLLDNPRKKIILRNAKMLRVVDVKKVLEVYSYNSTCNLDFSIRINDKYAKWNNKTFKVYVKNGNAKIDENYELTADVECSIQTFSQIMIGYISINEAFELAKIKVNDMNIFHDLKTIFCKKCTYINDRF